jgi:hypothetical protein
LWTEDEEEEEEEDEDDDDDDDEHGCMLLLLEFKLNNANVAAWRDCDRVKQEEEEEEEGKDIPNKGCKTMKRGKLKSCIGEFCFVKGEKSSVKGVCEERANENQEMEEQRGAEGTKLVTRSMAAKEKKMTPEKSPVPRQPSRSLSHSCLPPCPSPSPFPLPSRRTGRMRKPTQPFVS